MQDFGPLNRNIVVRKFIRALEKCIQPVNASQQMLDGNTRLYDTRNRLCRAKVQSVAQDQVDKYLLAIFSSLYCISVVFFCSNPRMGRPKVGQDNNKLVGNTDDSCVVKIIVRST